MKVWAVLNTKETKELLTQKITAINCKKGWKSTDRKLCSPPNHLFTQQAYRSAQASKILR